MYAKLTLMDAGKETASADLNLPLEVGKMLDVVVQAAVGADNDTETVNVASVLLRCCIAGLSLHLEELAKTRMRETREFARKLFKAKGQKR